MVELDAILADPNAKEALIRNLLEAAPQQKSQKKQGKETKDIPSAAEYEGKDDPQNPENEANFKKAYEKVL